jgi:hypothetical protein
VDQRRVLTEHGDLDDSWSCRSASHIRFIKTTHNEVKNSSLKISYNNIVCLVFRFDERSLMLYGGLFLMVVGRVVHIPWGSAPPIIKTAGFKLSKAMPASI